MFWTGFVRTCHGPPVQPAILYVSLPLALSLYLSRSLLCVWGVWVGLLCQFVSGAEFPLGSPPSSVVHISSVGNPSAVFNQPSSTCYLKGKFGFLNLDLISGIKYVYLLTDNSLGKVGLLQTLFRSLEIRVYPYNGSVRGIDNTASK